MIRRVYEIDPFVCARIEAEWGRAITDERYWLVISGVFRLPWRVTLAPMYEYGSGQPWNRVLGYDYNGDGWATDRPQGVSRNDRDGAPFRRLNLRLTKTFTLGGGGELDIIFEVFNLFNTTNYDLNSVDNAMNYSVPTLANPDLAYVPNPRFGTYLATHSPREVQVGLRYAF